MRKTGHVHAGLRRRVGADDARRSTRRKLLIALGATALTTPLAIFAQQQGKVWHIAYLDFGSRQSAVDSGRYDALMQGLREQGYVEGKNFVLEARYADGNADRLDGFAAELVRQKIDLIVSIGTVGSRAAHRATATIPIVVTNTSDPVREGFAASLARPGGNITGLSSGTGDTVQKLVELLIVAVPKLKRIAVISNLASGSHSPMLLSIQAAARQAGKQVLPVSVRTPDEIELGFATMVRDRTDAVIILGDTFLFSQRAQIAGLALKHRLPSIYPSSAYPEAGGLMSYGRDPIENFRRAGIFVDKILKGAKPGDIPFEQPTRYYLVINRKTANALSVKISGELLTRADKVVE
jgi:putative ABC transport system substrate-binding protein